MYSSYVPGFSSYLENTLLGGEQGLPSEQPVEAEPYVEPIDLGGWNLANFQNQFMQPGGGGALADYIGQQAALGNNYVSPLTDTNVMMPGMQAGLLNLYGETPEEQALRYYNLESRDTTTPITFDPRTYSGGYQLVDTSGKVLGTANSADQLQALIQQAGGMQGAKDAYSIQGARPDGALDTIFQQNPDYGTLGDLLVQMGAFALPAAGGAVLGPALAGTGALGIGVSPAVGVGLGTAAGSALSGVTAGKNLGDIIKQAAIAGITAGGLQALAGGPSAAADKVGGLAADLQTKVIDGALSVADASKMLANAGATSAQIAKFAADATGSFASTVPTVFGSTANAIGGLTSVASGAGGALSGMGGIGGQPGTTVTGSRDLAQPNNATLGGALSVVQPSGTNYMDQLPGTVVTGAQSPSAVTQAPPVMAPVISGGADPNTIQVTGSKGTKPLDDLAGALATSVVPILDAPTMTTTTAAPKKDLGLVDYLQLAGLGVGTLGSLFGGGGDKQGGGKWPGGAAPNPVFGSTLPSANLPGLTNGGGAPRTADELGGQGLRANQDWYRYAYGPQQSFFKHVQQGAPNTSQAFTGYAEGGNVQGYVGGAGDGRSDQIDAKLSDGEYVIDAETVALLGNGSNKAGADLLDQFRVNVRKHKGRELSRGNFSEDAMRPEHYLAGGLA